MKISKLHFSIIVLMVPFLSLSCQSDQNDFAGGRTYTIDLSQTQHNLSWDEVVDSVRFLPLQGQDLSVVSDLLLTNDQSLVVIDRVHRSLYIFDDRGKFVAAIDRQGKGPGEYVYFSGVAYDAEADEIYMHDPPTQKMLVFAADGTFLREKSIPSAYHVGARFALMGDHLLTSYRVGSDATHYVQRYDKHSLLPIDTLLPILNDPVSPIFPTSISSQQQSVVVDPQLNYKLYYLQKDQRIDSIALHFATHQPPASLIQQRTQLEVPALKGFDQMHPYVFSYYRPLHTPTHWMLQVVLQDQKHWALYAQKANKWQIFQEIKGDAPHEVWPDQVLTSHGNAFVGVYTKLDKIKSIHAYLGLPTNEDDLHPVIGLITCK